MSNRKVLFSLAAVLATGLGVTGCDSSSSSGSAGGDVQPSVTCGNIECVSGFCFDGVCDRTCVDYPDECASKDVLCSDTKTCHTDATCRGVGSCEYTCGVTPNSCQWAVCAKSQVCAGQSGVCDPNTLDPDDDADGDTIPNSIELNSTILDPCKADTDGDTVPDNLEDLNGNGVYEPHLGETDPSDPNSKPSSDDAALIGTVCSSEMTKGGRTERLDNFHVAVPAAIGASESMSGKIDKDSSERPVGVRYDDPAGIAMFFASSTDEINAKTIFKSVATDVFSNYVEASNFTSEIPLTSWIESGYKHDTGDGGSDLQIVPDHVVTRYVYRLNLGADKTIEDVRDALSSAFADQVDPMSSRTQCQADENGVSSATVYLARSTYDDGTSKVVIYSGAVACSETVKNTQISARLTDVSSGTHVAPKGIFGQNFGYTAYQQFMCQMSDYGDSSSKVDFIWVVDNSGSMEDELNNLAATAEEFMAKLDKSKIDFRIGVTGTDAYILDEWYSRLDHLLPQSTRWTINPIINGGDFAAPTNPYYTYSGLRYPVVQQRSAMAMMNSKYALRSSGSPFCASSAFACTVKAATGCSSKNLCGLGYEDGLKSGLVVLDRLSLDASGNYEDYADDKGTTEEEKAILREKRRKANSVFGRTNASSDTCLNGSASADEKCKVLMDANELRPDALRYIIWVSDEESRQVKEPVDGDVVSTNDSMLYGCKTGYKLTSVADGESTVDYGNPDLSKLTYNIYTGAYASCDDSCFKSASSPAPTEVYRSEADCNPSMRESIAQLVADHKLSEETSLEDLHTIAPQLYDVLMYHIQAYQKYAGERGIAGFALVGDVGLKEGGFCQELGNDSSSVVGANYGLSYILMAKYLSKLTSDGKNDGKGGGYASICSTNYSDTVNAIFEDVLGRLSQHVLQGYPIASTIRVAIVKKGSETATELVRGKDWSYDASQNTITFSYSGGEATDRIAISYVIWAKSEG